MMMNQPACILVVDDLEDNLDLIREHLDDDAFEVRTARSGQEALNSIAERLPDMVLLDVMMPGIDGIETCRQIKKRHGDAYLPVVLITAYDDSENRRRGLEAGAEDFISKPFDSVELMARIRNLLHTKRLYDDLSVAKARIEEEVEAVGALQRTLIPDHQPRIAGLNFYDYYLPSRQAGGDYFDYIPIDESRIGVAIGDVSGHGPPASVLMAMVKMILHMFKAHWLHPAQLLQEADAQLAQFVPPGEFVTMFYGVIDVREHVMCFASAGHCPPILFGPAWPQSQQVKVGEGFPLCLMQQNQFEEKIIKIPPQSRLLLYTDGLIEAQNHDRELFGLPRLLDLAKRLELQPGEEVIRGLLAEGIRWNRNESFRDDCTLLLVDWAD